jgi:methionyl aminopeptidase
MVVLRSKNEIEGMRQAGDLVAQALVLLRSHVRAGVRLVELDRIVEEFVRSEGGSQPTRVTALRRPYLLSPAPYVPRSTRR